MTSPPSSPSPYQLIGPSEDGRVEDLLIGKTDKEARQRIQALIAEWLRMENLVVLTGSGTSVSSGGKTMANLETAVLDTLERAPNLPAPIKRIIDARQLEALIDTPALGFEDWLSYVVNAAVVTGGSGSPLAGVTWSCGASPTKEELVWFIDKLGKAIFAECALSLEAMPAAARTASDIAPQLAFLSKLVARDSNLGRTHLFTLNYDTLLEQALERLGIQYFDGFSGRADARFDPSVYGLDVYYPGELAEGRVRRFDKFAHLYKLHGSIHWYIFDGELRSRHPDLKPFQAYRGQTAEQKAEALDRLAQDVPTVGILPTANKFMQTLTMPFAHLFRSFQMRLSAPQTFLLVLGYGFGDDHVSRVIETALMNPSLVLLVVEPNPASDTIRRIREYKDLGRRAFVLTQTQTAFDSTKFMYATFDDFARTLMPDVQWLDDFLRLRRFEKQIQAGGRDQNSEEPA